MKWDFVGCEHCGENHTAVDISLETEGDYTHSYICPTTGEKIRIQAVTP